MHLRRARATGSALTGSIGQRVVERALLRADVNDANLGRQPIDGQDATRTAAPAHFVRVERQRAIQYSQRARQTGVARSQDLTGSATSADPPKRPLIAYEAVADA